MTCPVCGQDRWELHLDKGSHTYVRCEDCGVVRLEPFPTPEEAAALYGDDYFEAGANTGYDDYVADESIHRRNARRRVRHLGVPPAASRCLVEVGCAHGFTMDEARAAGWEPLGVEANATARRGVESLGMHCVATPAELSLEPDQVGAVAYFQVLEHLPDPVAALRWAREVLAPGGRIVIETWNRSSLVARVAGRRWQVATPPSVLWLWDRPTLERVGAAAGLELVSHRASMKWVSLGLVAAQMRDRGARGPLVRAVRSLGRMRLPYALGDLVTVTMTEPPATSGGGR